MSLRAGDRLPQEVLAAAATIADAVVERQTVRRRPYVVAVDGPSGAGKSTISAVAARSLDAAVVWSDDFFAAGVTDLEWVERSPAERARDCIDWRRLRAEALEPLLSGRRAEWHAFDWNAGPRPDGTYGFEGELTVVEPGQVVIIDGAYSSRAELADLVDLSVLIDAPPATRKARLAQRDGAEHFPEWHAVWGAAEAFYFGDLRPREAFDLVVEN